MDVFTVGGSSGLVEGAGAVPDAVAVSAVLAGWTDAAGRELPA